MLLSILVPTNRRTKKLLPLVENVFSLAADPGRIELIFRVMWDDKETLDLLPFFPSERVLAIVGPRRRDYYSVDTFVNEAARLATGKYLWLFNDDAFFVTDQYDNIVAKLPKGLCCAFPLIRHPDNPEWEKTRHHDFPLISRELYESLGCATMGMMWDWFWDDVCERLPGILHHADDIIVGHTYDRKNCEDKAFEMHGPVRSLMPDIIPWIVKRYEGYQNFISS